MRWWCMPLLACAGDVAGGCVGDVALVGLRNCVAAAVFFEGCCGVGVVRIAGRLPRWIFVSCAISLL
ncbi:Uncharacterised protein [Dermatophilus congolensis]|uniref:Uncharacterized protein n=1 Tax=Dermatophilus congolensis TaxID=1863 RepID=A0AA46BM96_9MICO|nr:Uncharacterised protein [Dermatophilus congolensis]